MEHIIDSSAPECFYIEERLKKSLDIPVMHDDQHGTAIISSAGLLNALEVAGKKIDEVKIVVSGAGAAAIMCTKLYIALGAKKENVLMLDSKGVITSDRPNLTEQKKFFATDRRDVHTLEEAMVGADVFLGLSKGNVVSQDMIRSMAKNPIVFACANPTPEISYEDAMAARPDVLMSTGRSDYPNQINSSKNKHIYIASLHLLLLLSILLLISYIIYNKRYKKNMYPFLQLRLRLETA